MTEVTNEELHRQIRAYEATVHNLNLQLEAVGAGGVQTMQEPWGVCVSGGVWVGKKLPEHVRKLAEAENLPIKWLYTAPQPAVAAGWVMVPIEPTDAMIRAGKDAESNDGETHLRPAWRYMLKAAPPAPIATAAGWVMVPVEPNQKQIKAAADAWLDCGSKLILNKALAALRAGIAAAPITGERK